MRKYFDGLSPVRGAILLSVFFFGIFFRFYGLDLQSPWTDELASWYFLRNLDQVFLYESHSPLYYSLLRLFFGLDPGIYSLRMFSATVSVLYLILFFFVGQKFWEKDRLIIFMVLICLNPVDIEYARMARHYGILLEGSLFYLFLIQAGVRPRVLIPYGAFLGFIHVFAIIPICTIIFWKYVQNREWKRFFVLFSGPSLVIFYYLVRVIYLGHQKVKSNVAWNSYGFIDLLSSTFNQFLGEAYPRSNVYPIPLVLSLFLVGLALVFLIYRRTSSGKLFFLTWLISIATVEILALMWINLRINRYLIYLPGLLCFALTEAIPRPRLRYQIGLWALMLSLNIMFNPLKPFEWDNEAVKVWKSYEGQYPSMPRLICANRYQSAYYGLDAPTLCRDEVGKIDLMRPFLFFDLNNNDGFITLFLINHMRPVEQTDFRHSRIIRFEPR